MCGIFAVAGDNIPSTDIIKKCFMTTKHRGPDDSKLIQINKHVLFGFHRLSIMGIEKGNQPMITEHGCALICNGEIYNYIELAEKYGFNMSTGSDCEVILHMYSKFGIERTVDELDGVFAFILYDPRSGLYVARDPIGIRPLFIGTGEGVIAFSSEMKSLQFCEAIGQFPPGKWWHLSAGSVSFFSLGIPKVEYDTEFILTRVRELLEKAVEKRMMSDRPIGALLSGGVDSSLVASLVQKFSGDKRINTYSIGMPGSPDLKYAKKVAEYIGSKHYECLVKPEDFVKSIKYTIMQIESYDVTTVRASVGNLLVSNWISKNTDDKVIFCGDVSDELFGGYRGFSQAPTNESLRIAVIRMMSNIHFFDVLRSDRSISGVGLEARVPYADKKFMKFVMSLDDKHKRFGKIIKEKEKEPKIEEIDEEDIEKYILRKAFDGLKLIPDEVLWRRKEAFSDGVSGEREWFEILQEHAEALYSDEDYENKIKKYTHNQPYDKESLWYREIFEEHYPGRAGVIPYFWRHPFCTEIDPSARKLECY